MRPMPNEWTARDGAPNFSSAYLEVLNVIVLIYGHISSDGTLIGLKPRPIEVLPTGKT